MYNNEAIVIGTSAGGMKALETILSCLPAHFTAAIIIVQHRSPGSDDFLEHYLNDRCNLRVKQADEKENIIPGMVYLAPPDYHLLVEKEKKLSLSIDPRINYARPSIDVLFETAADAYGVNIAGVILTGAGKDGSQGLKRIKESGGIAVIQDPQTAESRAMPAAAISAVKNADRILTLKEIGLFLTGLSDGYTWRNNHE